MKIKKIIIGSVLGLSTLVGFNSCNYLDANEYLNEVDNLNDIWTDRLNIRKAWAACYGNIQHYSNVIESHPFTCNYDEAYSGRDTDKCLAFAQGKYGPDNPVHDFWSWYYQGIRKCCQFLENNHLANDKLLEEGEVEGYAADARFMRAFYYSQLLEQYGPFVIVDKSIDYSAMEEYPTTRATIDECVNFIVTELDSCMTVLKLNAEINSSDRGRPSKEAAMAMKARVLLWAASPLVNGNPDYSSFVNNDGVPFFNVGSPDLKKWEVAAKAYKEIIDLGSFELFTLPANDGYKTIPLGDFEGRDVEWPNGPAGIDPYRSYKALFAGGRDYWNSEVIWQVQLGSQTANLTLIGRPRSYNNSESARDAGQICATQKLVDNYFLNNGKTIDEDPSYNDLGFSTEGDDFYIKGDGDRDAPIITGFKLDDKLAYPANRVLNREPRFYATIGFSGLGYITNQDNIYYADYRYGQPDGYILTGWPTVRTGYSITKWINEEDRATNGTYDKQFPVFRLAEVYLSYAEALNESDPTNTDIVKYLNRVRWRAGLPGYELASQEINRERIKREIYVEFAFECKRYFDSRRWKDAEKNERDQFGNSKGMAGPVYGFNYLDGGPGSYNRTIIDGYIFKKKHYFAPIPYGEVANHWGTLLQNPGW